MPSQCADSTNATDSTGNESQASTTSRASAGGTASTIDNCVQIRLRTPKCFQQIYGYLPDLRKENVIEHFDHPQHILLANGITDDASKITYLRLYLGVTVVDFFAH